MSTYNPRLSTRLLTATLTRSILFLVDIVPDFSFSAIMFGAFDLISTFSASNPLSSSLPMGSWAEWVCLGRGGGWRKTQTKAKVYEPLVHFKIPKQTFKTQDCTITWKVRNNYSTKSYSKLSYHTALPNISVQFLPPLAQIQIHLRSPLAQNPTGKITDIYQGRWCLCSDLHQ